MSYANQQGGYPASGQKAAKKKEIPVNKVECVGIVKPRGNFSDIKVKDLPNGGAIVKFSLECKEMSGAADANGNPKVTTTYIPVSVFSNKVITVPMLQSVVEGMKVHVVGRWANQHYKDHQGVDKNFTECVAYFMEILEQPQAAVPQMPAYPTAQPYPYPQQPMPQGGQPYPYPAYPQAPMPPQYGQQPVPGYPAYAQPAPAAPAPAQGQPLPPYYVPPQQQGAAAPKPAQAPAPAPAQAQPAPSPMPPFDGEIEQIFP